MTLRRYTAVLLLSLSLLAPSATFAQQPAAPAKDPNDPIERIKDEGLNRSQVMQTLSYLSDVIGPRLTASPGMKRANEWTRDQLTAMGCTNAHLEDWGEFGMGWQQLNTWTRMAAPNTINTIARASKGCGSDRAACEEGANRLKGGRVSQVVHPGKRSLYDSKEVDRE